MTFAWDEDGFLPSWNAASGRIWLMVAESNRGGWYWMSRADTMTPGCEITDLRRWKLATVTGHAGTLEEAKTAAETMGRRMRKVLRWAR